MGAALSAGLLLSSCGGGGSPAAPNTPAPMPTPTPAPSEIVVLNGSNFDERVLRSEAVWLVEFYSPTCPHCMRMEPVVERLAADFSGRADVGQVNVDTERFLVRAWDIIGWPTFVVVKDGNEVDRWLGETTYGQLAAMIEAAFPSPSVGRDRVGSMNHRRGVSLPLRGEG